MARIGWPASRFFDIFDNSAGTVTSRAVDADAAALAVGISADELRLRIAQEHFVDTPFVSRRTWR